LSWNKRIERKRAKVNRRSGEEAERYDLLKESLFRK
jgi:hypothetical protein